MAPFSRPEGLKSGRMTAKRKYWTGTRKAPAQDKFFIEALDPDLWERGDANDWDACWHTSMPAPKVFKTMKRGAAINHIPGNNALTVKSKLYETLVQAREAAPSQDMRDRLSFFPETYLMPADYNALQAEAFTHPDKKWIVKPKRLSRGRGIRVEADAGAVPIENDWLVQEYLARPHLYDGYKYVLRLYLLIAGVEPLRIYLYRDGFVKLASEAYRDGDYENLYAHLTNPDINALNETKSAPVVFHSFDAYCARLRDEGADPDAFFDKVRDIAVLTGIAARDQMRKRLRASGAFAPGCFELIGLDCMVDADLKPWLLECNLSPSLDICAEPEHGGDYEAATKKGVVEDFISIMALNDLAEDHADFLDEALLGSATERERARSGRFECVYPAADAGAFLPYFQGPRYADAVLAERAAPEALHSYRLAPAGVHEIVSDDELALVNAQTGKIQTPGPAASFMWLKAAAGDTPDAIADALSATVGGGSASDAEKAAFRKEVWETLANWGAEGLLRPAVDAPAPPSATITEPSSAWRGGDFIRWNEGTIRIRYGAGEIASRLAPLIRPWRVNDDAAARAIDIVRAHAGYGIVDGSRLLRARLKLAEIAGFLLQMLLNEYQQKNQNAVILNAALCETSPDSAVLFIGTGRDETALAFCTETNTVFRGGAIALEETSNVVSPLPVPARIGADDAAIVIADPGPLQLWNDKRGYFISASGQDSEDTRCRIQAVFALRDSAKGNEAITPLNGKAGLLALSAARRPTPFTFDAQSMETLQAQANAAPVYEVRSADIKNAARECARRINDLSL